jgi:hypothetical protein
VEQPTDFFSEAAATGGAKVIDIKSACARNIG